MPRAFNGSTDRLICSVGAQTGTDGGPVSIGAIFRVTTQQNAGLLCVRNATPISKYGINPWGDANVFYSTDDGVDNKFASTTYPANEWLLLIFTKGDGSAQTRAHKYLYNSTTWTHTDIGSAFADSTVGTVTDIMIGSYHGGGGITTLAGDVAVAGIWNRVLSDNETTALTSTLASWRNSAPTALWVLNQPSTSDPVLDLTGNGANQSSLTGTTVSSSDVPGFSYEDLHRPFATRYAMLRDWRLVYG